jgi:protein pelota
MEDESFAKLLADVKAAEETKALQRFHATLLSDEDRACYGVKFVQSADEQLAVESLLVTDKFFKTGDVETRKQYITLMESVREHGGHVYIFSSMHVSGIQLDLYTGIAATLRFPLASSILEQDIEERAAREKAGGDLDVDPTAELDYWSDTDPDEE